MARSTLTLDAPVIRFNRGVHDGLIFKGRPSQPRGIRLALAGKHFDKLYMAGVQEAIWGNAQLRSK